MDITMGDSMGASDLVSPTAHKRRGGGRPRADATEKRSEHINVYVTTAERAELERRAQLAGMRDLGLYVRHAVVAQRPPRSTVPEVNRELLAEMRRIGVNINQIARDTNATRSLGILRAAELERHYRALRDLLEQVGMTLSGFRDQD